MVTRIVVADQGEARFYDRAGASAVLRAAGSLENPAAHQHDRDFKSDRPGRVFNRAPAAGQRRGTVARHATTGERRPRKREAELFAKRIAPAGKTFGHFGIEFGAAPEPIGHAVLDKPEMENPVGPIFGRGKRIALVVDHPAVPPTVSALTKVVG